jgi:hypothetical protein
VIYLVSDSEQLLINLGKRLNQTSIENNTLADSVDRFKVFFENLYSSDELLRNIPIVTFKDSFGLSPFFRFDYDRFDYGRFGDMGGMDDISYFVW